MRWKSKGKGIELLFGKRVPLSCVRSGALSRLALTRVSDSYVRAPPELHSLDSIFLRLRKLVFAFTVAE
jgi:hypothetical protein